MEPKSRLCGTCSKIDFRSLAWRFSQKYEDSRSVLSAVRIDIGSIEDVSSRVSDCELCRLIASRLQLVDNPDIKQQSGDRCLIITSFSQHARISEQDLGHAEGRYFSADWIKVQIEPTDFTGFHGPVIPARYWKDPSAHGDGDIGGVGTRPWQLMTFRACTNPVPDVDDFCQGPLRMLPPANESRFSGRRRKDQINPLLPRRWLQICEKFHESTCSGTKKPVVKTLKLIDLELMAIVSAPTYCEYVALSYCWGSAKTVLLTLDQVETLSKPGALEGKPMPNTISDAFQVTRDAGIRYIWIDALCIIQDDAEMLASQIPQMARIYEQSSFTIMAAKASSADAGLAGVRPGTRKILPDEIHMAELSLIATPEETSCNFDDAQSQCGLGRKGLNTGRWRSRGWTMQEEFSSRRLLYFEADRISWWCNAGLYQEETAREIPNTTSKENSGLEYLDIHKSLFPLMTKAPLGWDEYTYIVRDYSRRQLTFSSDALNAIQGMLQNIYVKQGCQTFWGHPQTWFVASLEWWASDKLERNLGTQKVILSDSTQIETPFPSWSWPAWVGKGDPAISFFETITHPYQSNFYQNKRFWAPSFYICHADENGETVPHYCINDSELAHDSQRNDVICSQGKHWIGSPLHIDLSSSKKSQPFIDCGLMQFWSSKIAVYILRLQALRVERDFEYNLVSQNGLLLDANPEMQATHTLNWSHSALLNDLAAPTLKPHLYKFGDFLEIEAVVIKNSWRINETSGTLVVLLVTLVDNVYYRVGIGMIAEKRWIQMKSEWALITLG